MAKKLWFYLHWFLGLTAGFVLMIVGVSGALLSFEKEILESINHSSLHVNVPAKVEPLSMDALVQRFVESHKDARIAGVTKASDPSSSFMIHVETSNNQKKASLRTISILITAMNCLNCVEKPSFKLSWRFIVVYFSVMWERISLGLRH